MLNIFRRHKKSCKHRDEGRHYRRCLCPISVDGTVGGEEIRKSLRSTSWEEASQTIQQWESVKKIVEPEPPHRTTTNEAWNNMSTDVTARKLSASTIRKYSLLRRQMEAYAQQHGIVLLSEWDLDTLTRFRATWKDGPRTAAKKIERLRAFFRFCTDREWVVKNPATNIKIPKIPVCPTMPLSREELVKLLAACDNLAAAALASAKPNALRLKNLILLMRYSGLRVSDAVTLTKARLDGSSLFLYTAKSGVPVRFPLPDLVLDALEATPCVTEARFFWSGQGKRETAVCDWQSRIKDAFDEAGIVKGLSNAVSHRLRDTFAVELLLAGVPIERVSVLLGHQSVRITEKHYAPWTRSRQDQLEADVKATWKSDPILATTKHTPSTHETPARYN